MFVRTAGERDVEAVRRLLAETCHATYDAIYGADRVDEITAEWHSTAALKARLKRPNAEFLVADDGKQLGGMAFAAADGDVATLHQLYVLPAFQRQGIGTALLTEIEDSFFEAKTLRLEVEDANQPAIAFYLRHGFTRIRQAATIGDLGAISVYEKPLG